MYGPCLFDEMRIRAFQLECNSCGWRGVYPLKTHPETAVTRRAHQKAGQATCKQCGRAGLILECRWDDVKDRPSKM